MPESLPVLDPSAARPDPEAGFGALETAKGPLPLKALQVQARILGLITRVAVTQTFVNTHREPLEAVYIFPLPPRAAVSGFTMRVGGRLVVGKLAEREEARRKYSEALREGRRAALAEEDRADVFTLSVGNLMPGDVAEVAFEMVGMLAMKADEVQWRFPLVVAPRYIAGAALDLEPAGMGTGPDTDLVPDASRLNPPVLLPGYPNPVRLGIDVEWNPAGLPITDIRSSLHAVTESQADGVMRIRLQQAERLDCDFVLRGRLLADAVEASVVLAPDAEGLPADPEGDTGTLMVTLIPPFQASTARPGRDVVFLLDRSGSMEGWKLAAARRAMATMVDSLGHEDRFAVLRFDTREDCFSLDGAELLPATDANRCRATEFLARTTSGGGTELGRALRRAIGLLPGPTPGREAIVFLVTDGQVGEEDRILSMIGASGTRCRFQILGIDSAVNGGLLQKLADATGGWFLAAESEQVLDGVLLAAGRQFGAPTVAGITLDARGLQWNSRSLASSGSLDLYPRTPLVLLARYREAPEQVSMTVKGEAFSRCFTARSVQEPALRNVWCRFRLRALEDALARNQGARTAERELVRLSLAFGVLCRFTAFLAVDEAAVANPQGRIETIVQPVERPRGWAGSGSGDLACLPSSFPSVSCDDDLAFAFGPAPSMDDSCCVPSVIRCLQGPPAGAPRMFQKVLPKPEAARVEVPAARLAHALADLSASLEGKSLAKPTRAGIAGLHRRCLALSRMLEDPMVKDLPETRELSLALGSILGLDAEGAPGDPRGSGLAAAIVRLKEALAAFRKALEAAPTGLRRFWAQGVFADLDPSLRGKTRA